MLNIDARNKDAATVTNVLPDRVYFEPEMVEAGVKVFRAYVSGEAYNLNSDQDAVAAIFEAMHRCRPIY